MPLPPYPTDVNLAGKTEEAIARRINTHLKCIRAIVRDNDATADDVALLAVSKGRSVNEIAVAVAAGQRLFGESRVQEALPKIEALSTAKPPIQPPLEWHFIGPIQSNKTRAIAKHFAWVHSISRVSIAQRLSEQRPAELGPINACVQINTSGERSKSGVTAAELGYLLEEISDLPMLRIRGLMALPAYEPDTSKQREVFRSIRDLYNSLSTVYHLDTLSCGMSDDFQSAVAAGASMVRIGRGLFGNTTPEP